MDTFAFVAHAKFILAATDSHYKTKFHGLNIDHKNCKKVRLLTKNFMISGVGSEFKVWDIYKYLNKLASLGHLTSYSETMLALSEVFNSTKEEWQTLIAETQEILKKAYSERPEIPSNELLDLFKDKPSHQAILQDLLTSMQHNQALTTEFHLLGWDKEANRARATSIVSVGHKLHSSELPLEDQKIFIQSASVNKDIPARLSLEQQAIKTLIPIAAKNTMQDVNEVGKLIDDCKEVLSRVISGLNPYEELPNVVYYEISERTNFQFLEPATDLKEIIFNR